MDNWKVIFILSFIIAGCLAEINENNFDQAFGDSSIPPKVSDSFSSWPIQTGTVRFSPVKPKFMPIHMRRKKRSSPSSGVAEDVCPSVSDWVAKVGLFEFFSKSNY